MDEHCEEEEDEDHSPHTQFTAHCGVLQALDIHMHKETHNNSTIIGGKPVFYPRWYQKGIYLIGDFIKDYNTMTFFNYDEFIQKNALIFSNSF